MNANVQFIRRTPDLRYARVHGWIVDVPANRITRGGIEVRLTPKSMAVLRELLARPATVVRRDDLLGIVWRDGFPTDDVLTHAITELRRALEDDPRAPRIIETIPKVGYRLLATVEPLDEPPTPPSVPVVTTVMVAPVAPETPPRAPWLLWATVGALAVLAVLLPLRQRATTAAVATAGAAPAALASAAPPAESAQPTALSSDPTREQFPSLSPDGSTAVYVAVDEGGRRSRLMLRSLDAAADPVGLTDPPESVSDTYPTWSPDGKQIAFLRMTRSDCGIHVMPALGGQVRHVADCFPRTIDYIDWTSDGAGLLLSRRGVLADGLGPNAAGSVHRLDLASGAITPITYAPAAVGNDDLQPRSSPDGRWIAFRRGAYPYSDIWVMPASGGEARQVTRLRAPIRGYAWHPDSTQLLISSAHERMHALYRVDIATGTPIALGVSAATFPSVARHAAVMVWQNETELAQLMQFAPGTGVASGSGAEGEPLAGSLVEPSTRSEYQPAISPDGGRMAFISTRSGEPQVWVRDFASGSAFPLTRLQKREPVNPQWSPDATSLLFVARSAGSSELMRIEIASGRMQRLSQVDERARWGAYARDGRSIYFSSDRSGAWQVWRMDADGANAGQLSTEGGYDPRDWLGDGAIYYTKETDRGLFRLELATRAETRVSWITGYWNMDAFVLRHDGIWYLEIEGDDNAAWLMHAPLDPAVLVAGQDSASRRVHRLDGGNLIAQISLAGDLSRLVAVTITRDETDVMTMPLPGG